MLVFLEDWRISPTELMTLVAQRVFLRVEDRVWRSSQWGLRWEYGKQIEGGDQHLEKNRYRMMEFAMSVKVSVLVTKKENQQEVEGRRGLLMTYIDCSKKACWDGFLPNLKRFYIEVEYYRRSISPWNLCRVASERQEKVSLSIAKVVINQTRKKRNEENVRWSIVFFVDVCLGLWVQPGQQILLREVIFVHTGKEFSRKTLRCGFRC